MARGPVILPKGMSISDKETPQNKRIEYGQLRVDSFWEAAVVSVA